MKRLYSTGADSSPYDLRTFAYKPTGVPVSGGVHYDAKDIEDQHKVGICTAISLTQNARKATGVAFSADFQYLLQKKFIDKNWNEGSSISSALKVAKNYGLLPVKYFPYIAEKDRTTSYEKYVKKLQAITDEQIADLLKISADYKIAAYQSVPISTEMLKSAMAESSSGLLVRHVLDEQWWTNPIEPIRKAVTPISGHAVTESNYNGDKTWIANSWGSDWAQNGSAYRLDDLKPTEAWTVHYGIPPEQVQKQLDARKTKLAKIVDVLQQLIVVYQQLNALKNK